MNRTIIDLPESALAVVARLQDDEDVDLVIRTKAGRVRRAMDSSHRGPDVVTTTWCAKELGFSSREWRDWAAEIPGATKDGAGRWRLPNGAAREHFATMLERTGSISPPSPRRRPPQPSGEARVTPIARKRRGPWKKEAHAGGKP